MSIIYKVILFAFALTACVHESPPDEGLKDAWPLTDRTHFYDEKIHVHFKSGNIRTGKLVQSPDFKKIELGNSSNKGIYNLKEVTAIFHGPDLIWKNNEGN